MNYYEKVKELGIDRGKSIYAIEKGSGLSNGLISKWKNSEPSMGSLIKVADFLDISLDDLVKDFTTN